MFRLSKRLFAASATLGLVAGFAISSLAAPPADWSKIPTKTVTSVLSRTGRLSVAAQFSAQAGL